MVEEDRSHVVQVSIEREKLPSCGQRPHLDLVVIAAGYEEGLGFVEVDASDRAAVAFESVDQGSHAVCKRKSQRSAKMNIIQVQVKGQYRGRARPEGSPSVLRRSPSLSHWLRPPRMFLPGNTYSPTVGWSRSVKKQESMA